MYIRLMQIVTRVTRQRALLFLMLLVLLPVSLRAQEWEQGVDLWIGIPISLSGQIPAARLNNGKVFENIREAEVNALVQVMFPLGSTISVGPEAGVSYPPRLVEEAAQANAADRLLDTIHLPLRFVLDIAVSESGLFHIQLLGGMRFNFWNDRGARGLKTLTFDVGGRVEIAGIFFETTYSLPYALNLDRSTSSKASANALGVWDNSLYVAIGYLIRV